MKTQQKVIVYLTFYKKLTKHKQISDLWYSNLDNLLHNFGVLFRVRVMVFNDTFNTITLILLLCY